MPLSWIWTLLCFISVILSICVRCNCTDEDTESLGDQASHVRHMWLLSMRDVKMREKAVIGGSNPARHQLLYCRVGIGFHLQIVMNGSVWGVHEPSELAESVCCQARNSGYLWCEERAIFVHESGGNRTGNEEVLKRMPF
ncbi:uncharacterized protein fgf9 isoform X2 [Carassius gibelio]|uniref:uncharacterized protein fgf9 isoform X2 n=1 Tax=Carassius gibelio TaxID=101364 RepID=UPI00227848AA|nr:uncharacterized protein fgf9 isoform X2 [Carassius gibelio]